MRPAQQVAARLLESGFGYGEQERPEHWEEVPYGFSATCPDRRLEFKWDEKSGSYFMSVYWQDDYSGEPRQLLNAGRHRTDDPETWIANKTKEFRDNGWTVELL